MAEIRRGTAMLITAGDAEIAGALASGIEAGRKAALTNEQICVVKKEIDLQRVAELMRVAMHHEPVDYAGLAYDAELMYGKRATAPAAIRWMGGKLLIGYALIVLAFMELFRSVGLAE